MQTIKIFIHNDQEKAVLLAFLDNMDYRYYIENNEFILSEDDIQEMKKRKSDFLSGKTTARSWQSIKRRYEA